MMKKKISLIVVMAVLVLSGCATKSQDAYLPSVVDMGVGGGAAPEQAAVENPVSDEPYRGTVKTDASGMPVQERLVIQNADVTIVIADPQAKMASISAMAKEMGGFVVSSNLYQNYTSTGKPVPEGSIVIRIPAIKMDAALGEIKADAVEVRNENRTGQDVTQEYVDLNSQLRSLQAAEEQLAKIMLRAEKTEDVLSVFSQLESYRLQIEVVKGQIQYYEQASALSAISITLIAEETIQPIEIGGWKPVGVARDAIQSLIKFWQGFVDFMINFFLLVLPILLTILLPILLVYLAIRAIVRRRRVKKTPPAA